MIFRNVTLSESALIKIISSSKKIGIIKIVKNLICDKPIRNKFWCSRDINSFYLFLETHVYWGTFKSKGFFSRSFSYFIDQGLGSLETKFLNSFFTNFLSFKVVTINFSIFESFSTASSHRFWVLEELKTRKSISLSIFWQITKCCIYSLTF